MKKLIYTAMGISIGSGIVLALLAYSMPKPKAKMPDARYGPSPISSGTVKTVQDYTVLIANENMGDDRWRGTGILLSSTTVMTCAHVIPENKKANTLWIYIYPGDKVVHGKLKFINQPQDIALLELNTPVSGHGVPVFARTAVLGEPIISVGNIRGYMLWFASYGIISGEHDRWVLSDAMIRGGNSGGPWANSKGEIVAMTDVGWEDGSSAIAGGIPTEQLQKFLVEAAKKKPSAVYELTGE